MDPSKNNSIIVRLDVYVETLHAMSLPFNSIVVRLRPFQDGAENRSRDIRLSIPDSTPITIYFAPEGKLSMALHKNLLQH